MPVSIHFARSLRRLESDGSRQTLALLAFLTILIGLWAAWFFKARVSIYATTGVARLEVSQENHPVDTPVVGRVTTSHLVAGKRVEAGDLLLELDANPQRLERSEAMAK